MLILKVYDLKDVGVLDLFKKEQAHKTGIYMLIYKVNNKRYISSSFNIWTYFQSTYIRYNWLNNPKAVFRAINKGINNSDL